MEQIKCQFRVEVVVKLSKFDLDHLMDLSRRHYDLRCRQLSSIQQPLGLLGRIKLLMDDADTVEYVLTWDDVDILCKITESEQLMPASAKDDIRLYFPLRRIFAEMRQESERVNTFL